MKRINRFTYLYYQYLKRTGLFRLLLRNIVNLFLIVLIISVIVYFIERYIISTKEVFIHIVDNVKPFYVYLLFTVSESLLGLIPPDLFIVWSEPQAIEFGINKWLLVTLLAVLSYVGGLVSFIIGRKAAKIPVINYWLLIKNQKIFIQLQKWGGFFIVLAALFPLPYSLVTMLAGMTSYPVKWLFILGFFRIVRFFVYAIFLFYIF